MALNSAESALRSSCSTLNASLGNRLMPMLVFMDSWCPSIRNGSLRPSMIRWANAAA
ncbi:hypothetical protein D9M69_584100 [compost metagenome]